MKMKEEQENFLLRSSAWKRVRWEAHAPGKGLLAGLLCQESVLTAALLALTLEDL